MAPARSWLNSSQHHHVVGGRCGRAYYSWCGRQPYRAACTRSQPRGYSVCRQSGSTSEHLAELCYDRFHAALVLASRQEQVCSDFYCWLLLLLLPCFGQQPACDSRHPVNRCLLELLPQVTEELVWELFIQAGPVGGKTSVNVMVPSTAPSAWFALRATAGSSMLGDYRQQLGLP